MGSGAAALIYEVVWQQLLQLVIGSSTVSLGVLLGTYMGGMCLGSLFGPRLLSSGQHPLRLYGLLEGSDRRDGACALLCDAARDAPLHSHWRRRSRRRGDASAGRWNMPAAADLCHGRDAAGGGTLGRAHAARAFLARAFLRRESRRCRLRMSACRVLSPAGIRHGGHNLCRRRDEPAVAAAAWLASARAQTPGTWGMDDLDVPRSGALRVDPTNGEAVALRHRVYVAIAAVGVLRACRGGRLDADAGADIRRHGLYVLDRTRPSSWPASASAAPRARRSSAAGRTQRLGSVGVSSAPSPAWPGRPTPCRMCCHFCRRAPPAPRASGRCSRSTSGGVRLPSCLPRALGSQFSTRPRRCFGGRSRHRNDCWPGLRREHRGRHCGRARHESRPDTLVRFAARAAGDGDPGAGECHADAGARCDHAAPACGGRDRRDNGTTPGFGSAQPSRHPRGLRTSRGGLGGARRRDHLRRRRHARLHCRVANRERRAQLPQCG